MDYSNVQRNFRKVRKSWEASKRAGILYAHIVPVDPCFPTGEGIPLLGGNEAASGRQEALDDDGQ